MSRQGPERILIVAAIGQGKSTAMRAISERRGRTVTIDCKAAGLPGRTPHFVSTDPLAVVREIRSRATAPTMDIVYQPIGPDGRSVWTSSRAWWGALRPILDAVEDAAIAGGWITVCIEELAVFNPRDFAGAWAQLRARMAVNRRGAQSGRGGWSWILTAQSAAFVPPEIRKLCTTMLLRPVGIDDREYMRSRWKMAGAEAIYSRAAALDGQWGKWLRVDMVTGKSRVVRWSI